MIKNRYSRYARAILFMMAGVVLMAGCVRDHIEHEVKTNVSDGSLTLSIALPEPEQKNMTRAMHADYNTIQNLNIIIATGEEDTDTIQEILYLDAVTQAAIEAAFPDGLVESDDSVPGVLGIHFSKEWADLYGISTEDCAFFILANWGNKVSQEGERIYVGQTVGDMREMKIRRRDHAMFGKSDDITGTGEDDHTTNPDHEDGRTLKIQLERLTAMITVEIVGTEGLNPNVQIIPTSISLHNVPAWGTLGENTILTAADRITPLTDANLGGAIVPTEGTVSVSDWGILSRGGSVGGHYDDPDVTWSGPTVADIVPLFMYENHHGDKFGEATADQKYKRPAVSVVGDDAYSDPPTPEEIEAVTAACSYLQVDARYSNTTDPQNPQYGTVTYRLFLGGNIYDDFNVMRNTYYKVTLLLSGSAIGEANVTWRMDSNIGTIEISDDDFVMNGGAEAIWIDMPKEEGNNSGWTIEFDGNRDGNPDSNDWPASSNGGDPFVYIYSSNNNEGGQEWRPLDEANKIFSENAVGHAQLRLFVQPMIRDVTWEGDGHMRQITFRMTKSNDGLATSWITVTQYEPIEVTIDENSPENIREYATETLGWTLPRTFYLDRVDNDDRPWGFNNTMIENQGSGLANVDALLSSGEQYLPYGDESAMMHAGFMRYYQRASPVGMVLPATIADITTNTPPPGYPRDFCLPSVAEWQLIDMLYKADIQVDDPTIIWNDYWTSDAVPNDPERSYVYQLGSREPEMVDRDFSEGAHSVKYRMMYFK